MDEERKGNGRRCGQIGTGEDDELSMVDVLNEYTRLQADAVAVLGASDANNCTQKGMKRQALYACATCTPNGNAGICLACSYACHEGHDLYELYTKRHFTCDCGNEKFDGRECKLSKEKKGLNSSNRYNQNFRGLYCSCSRPYPDPEDPEEDEMIQCVVCEDWYHARHLRTPVNDSNDFSEMICPDCMSKYPFLWAYHVNSQETLILNGESTSHVDVLKSSNEQQSVATTATWSEPVNSADDHSEDPVATETTASQYHNNTHNGKEDHVVSELASAPANDSSPSGSCIPQALKRERDECATVEEDDDKPSTPKKAKLEEQKEAVECVLESLLKRVVDSPDCAAFWPEGWRAKLCRCPACLEMYRNRDLEFLIDESDTVQAYEEKGKDSDSTSSAEETEASALAGMDRVQQIEIVRGFHDLKTELNEFFHGFAREGKVVTETDIREFFVRMDQRRRERVQMPQYNCR